jgi:type IV secretory pathway VirJ component
VVGLNSLQYFWTPRNPSVAGADLERVIRRYLTTWKKEEVILIGYSFGADVLPFMAAELPTDLRNRIKLVALLGPGRMANFEFHLTNWLGKTSKTNSHPVLPAVRKLQGTETLCFFGADEKESLCKEIDPSLATPIELKGGHHFGGDYKKIADTIRQAIKPVSK